LKDELRDLLRLDSWCVVPHYRYPSSRR
jgi:hypothetical protein